MAYGPGGRKTMGAGMVFRNAYADELTAWRDDGTAVRLVGMD